MEFNDLRKELVELQLAYSAFKNIDGTHSIGVRTNDQAADIIMDWLVGSGIIIIKTNNIFRPMFEIGGTHTSVNNFSVEVD